MKSTELLTTVGDAVTARRVYSEPVERDGTIVITAATVAGGGGGGQGQDDHGREGGGGGVGLTARPAGAYVLKGGTVGWVPAVDVNRLIATLGAVAVVFLVTRSRIIRARLKAAARDGTPS